MAVKIETFYLQKKDNSQEEYEDSYAAEKFSESEYRVSIADGATESSFAGIWARLLTEGYSKGTVLETLQNDWKVQIDAMELPWYSKEKAEQGAFAAFLGLTIFTTKNYWEAISVGDCCMFQIRQNKVIKSFPISSSKVFDNSPSLLCSLIEGTSSQPEFETQKGKWRQEDSFFLMTDALASWFLSTIEKKGDAINLIMAISSADDFVKLVDSKRSEKDENNIPLLKNDDTTLVKIIFES